MKQMNDNLEKLLIFIKSVYNYYINQYSSKINIQFQKHTFGTVLTENGRFISPKLKEMINSVRYLYWTTKFVIKEIPINVEVYKPIEYDTDNTKIHKIIELIKFVSYLCKTINGSFKDSISIKLILSPFKKELSENENLSAQNVNSGFTIRDYGKGESKIVIFREEEIVKVLIHELLHSFDIDSKLSGERYDIKFSKLFKKETAINLNESFTESFACLLNVCLASIYISNIRRVSLRKTFMTLLDFERQYILSVGEKVGKYNMQNKREATNTTSYYVLKAINWLNIEDFIEYVVKHNYMIGTYREYAVYLGEKLNFNIEKINKMEFSSENDKKNENNKNNKSIRMSYIDILDI